MVASRWETRPPGAEHPEVGDDEPVDVAGQSLAHRPADQGERNDDQDEREMDRNDRGEEEKSQCQQPFQRPRHIDDPVVVHLVDDELALVGHQPVRDPRLDYPQDTLEGVQPARLGLAAHLPSR